MDMAPTRRRPHGPVLGAILAGGAGSRMGGAKATAPLAGRPLISYPLRAVIDAGLEPLVFAKEDTELPALDVPVLREAAHDAHPLHGIVEALRVAEGRPVVVVACDMPFASAQLLAWLADIPDVAVPCVGGILQPLLARYEGAALAALARGAAEGGSVRETVSSLRPQLIGEPEIATFGDPWRLLLNVNDRQDLRRAAELLRPQRAGESDHAAHRSESTPTALPNAPR